MASGKGAQMEHGGHDTQTCNIAAEFGMTYSAEIFRHEKDFRIFCGRMVLCRAARSNWPTDGSLLIAERCWPEKDARPLRTQKAKKL